MAKHLFRLILLAVIVASGIYLIRNLGGLKPNKTQTPALTTTAASSDQETTVDSPDAKLTLSMLEQKSKDSATYLFFVKNNETGAKNQIFSKTVGLNETLFIPHNTWSPDYKYIFLKEGSPTQSRYFVLTSAGSPLTKDSQTVEIAELFAKKYPDYKITDVTGWAAPTLIILNTSKGNGTEGPSFWFEVPSGAFVQLSSHF